MYDRVRDSYDRVAKRYAEEMAGELAGKPLDRALLRCVHDLVRDFEESSPTNGIVDLGCGPGHIAAYLAALDLPVTGIDISAAMTELGARRYPEVSFREDRCSPCRLPTVSSPPPSRSTRSST